MDLYEEISKVAYEVYDKSGRVEGHDLDNWLEAERIVMARHRVEEKLKAESSFSPKKKKALTTKGNKTETKTRKTKE